MRFSPSVTAVLSYDGLRNYRDYFTRDVPEQIFDDLLHQGFRGSLYLGQRLRPERHRWLRPSPARAQQGAPGPDLELLLLQRRHSARQPVLEGHLARTPTSTPSRTRPRGYLVTAQAGKRFRRGHQFDLGYGRSLYQVHETRASSDAPSTFGSPAAGTSGRHVYLMADVEYDRGDDLRGPRGFFEIGYQF